jgi:hypothetical protein
VKTSEPWSIRIGVLRGQKIKKYDCVASSGTCSPQMPYLNETPLSILH